MVGWSNFSTQRVRTRGHAPPLLPAWLPHLGLRGPRGTGMRVILGPCRLEAIPTQKVGNRGECENIDAWVSTIIALDVCVGLEGAFSSCASSRMKRITWKGRQDASAGTSRARGTAPSGYGCGSKRFLRAGTSDQRTPWARRGRQQKNRAGESIVGQRAHLERQK